MTIKQTPLGGLHLVKGSPIADDRGRFERLFCNLSLKSIFDNRSIVQINQSLTAKVGAVRGLHFQHPPHAEMKCVRCLQGRVWDIALDIRPNSSTRFQWFATELSEENNLMLVIPEGFAHGFQVLEPNSRLLYLHTAHYAPDAEGGYHLLDPAFNIQLPLPVTDWSQRDQHHPFVSP